MLETQKSLILSKLVSLILVTLTFRVVHFGAFTSEHDLCFGMTLTMLMMKDPTSLFSLNGSNMRTDEAAGARFEKLIVLWIIATELPKC